MATGRPQSNDLKSSHLEEAPQYPPLREANPISEERGLSRAFPVQGTRNIAVQDAQAQLGSGLVRLGDWLRGRGHPWDIL